LKSFFEWYEQYIEPAAPWLILGKGPSFALRDRFDLRSYRLLSLNPAVREQPVLVAHIIDLDVVEACGDALERNASVLVMPWYPHIGNEPGSRDLAALAASEPILRRLNAEGRLLWYDLSTAPLRHGNAPVVEATYFSAEAALNLLALSGAQRVRTLGVDGGTSYSTDFTDLTGRTLLANGRASFDLQFQGFAGPILRTGVDVAPLDAPTPARICVAHTAVDTLPLAVLDYSIRKRASISVEVVPLAVDAALPDGEEGRSLVLSPRSQCLADIRPLWLAPIGADEVLLPGVQAQNGSSPPITLALVGPNRHAHAAILAAVARDGRTAETLSAALRPPIGRAIEPIWRPSLQFRPGQTKLLHYSAGTEPWLSRYHPFGHVWMQDLLEAVGRRFISEELVAGEVSRGHVRPSLAYQVEHRLVEAALLPHRARRLDHGFRTPDGARFGGVTVLGRSSVAVRALAREAGRRARSYRSRRRSRGAGAAGRPQPPPPVEARARDARRTGIAARK
jgi:hypothetical protein